MIILLFYFQEDEIIIQMVNKLGPKKWSTIAQALPGRIGKQCRERYDMKSTCSTVVSAPEFTNVSDATIFIYFWSSFYGKIGVMFSGN